MYDKYLRVTSSRTGKLVTCSVDVKAGVLGTVVEEKKQAGSMEEAERACWVRVNRAA